MEIDLKMSVNRTDKGEDTMPKPRAVGYDAGQRIDATVMGLEEMVRHIEKLVRNQVTGEFMHQTHSIMLIEIHRCLNELKGIER